MVVAGSIFERLKVRFDALANGMRSGEIHRRAGHRRNLAGGDETRISRQILRGIKRELVIKNGSGGVTGKIPIRVMH